MRNNLLIGAMITFAVISTFLPSNASTTGKNVRQTSAVRMPGMVNRATRVHLPADGEVHTTSLGKFHISPDTLFCEVPADIDEFFRPLGWSGIGLVGLPDLLRSMGQEAYLNGSIRTVTISDPRCLQSGNNIFHKGYALRGKSGQPFRIVMAVWQGDTYWVGQIAKEVDPDNPQTWGPLPWRMGAPHINLVIFPAINKIGAAFATHVRATK